MMLCTNKHGVFLAADSRITIKHRRACADGNRYRTLVLLSLYSSSFITPPMFKHGLCQLPNEPGVRGQVTLVSVVIASFYYDPR